MLSQLRVKNFQGHKDSTIVFTEGVNCIIGDPQSGKTGLQRALRLLAYNRPLGAKYFSNFAKSGDSTLIEAQVDGKTVSLEKIVKIGKDGTKKVESGTYRMGDFNSSAEDVPDFVKEALNISELNIQTQLDPPFLITSSAGEVAKTVNRITKLEQVDEWVSDLTRQINKVNGDIETSRNNIKNYTESIKQIQLTLQHKDRVTKLKTLSFKLEELRQEQEELSDYFYTWKGLEKEIKENEDMVATVTDAMLIITQTVTEYQTLSSEYDDLANLCEALHSKDRDDGWISDVEKNILRAETLYKKKEELMMEEFGLSQFIDLVEEVNNYDAIYNTRRNEFVSEIKRLGICPICSSEMNDSVIKRMEESL